MTGIENNKHIEILVVILLSEVWAELSFVVDITSWKVINAKKVPYSMIGKKTAIDNPPRLSYGNIDCHLKPWLSSVESLYEFQAQ